jgi:hypothetical protein
MIREVKQREREEAEARLPMPRPDLAALFDLLDERLGPEPCDHSLRHTRAFLDSSGLSRETVLPWLADQGGHCDCEILSNVENIWGDQL